MHMITVASNMAGRMITFRIVNMAFSAFSSSIDTTLVTVVLDVTIAAPDKVNNIISNIFIPA